MGGKAFDDLGLRVLRMPPDVYHETIAKIQPKLEKFFDKVVVPRNAPGKTDYGDIDFLVDGIRPQEGILWRSVQGALGADHHKRGASHSYALPHPNVQGAHVQVDVELNPGDFQWTKFMKGDGDLLQIIGIAHRPLGLTCNDKGLHVRLAEIEPYDKKESRLFLTKDPIQAMHFYGLNVDAHNKGFNNETDLFDWVAAGRFFSREVFEQRIEKADDRTRSVKRPMYRRFVQEYMPRVTHGSHHEWSRQDVLHKSLEVFNVQAHYDEKMAKHNSEEAERLLWKEVKAVIPVKDKSLKLATRTLRRWVGFRDGKPVRLDRANFPEEYFKWTEHVSQSNKSEVLAWVERNWRDIKSRDKA